LALGKAFLVGDETFAQGATPRYCGERPLQRTCVPFFRRFYFFFAVEEEKFSLKFFYLKSKDFEILGVSCC